MGGEQMFFHDPFRRECTAAPPVEDVAQLQAAGGGRRRAGSQTDPVSLSLYHGHSYVNAFGREAWGAWLPTFVQRAVLRPQW